MITYLDNKKEEHCNINITGNHCIIGSKLPLDLEAEQSSNVLFDTK